MHSAAAPLAPKRRSSWLTRYWLAVAIALVVTLALLWPAPGLAVPRLHLIDIGVVVVTFLGSLKLPFSSFKGSAKTAGLAVASLGFAFGIAPALALLLAEAVGLGTPDGRLAVLISAAQGSTLATAIVLTEIAGGDVALAMILTVVNNLASAVLTPLVFTIFSSTDVQVDALSMAQELTLKIILPALAAQVARRWLKGFAARHGRKLSLASQGIILMYVYAGVAAAKGRVVAHSTELAQVVLLVVVLHLGLVICSAAFARLVTKDAGARVAFALCSSQKTLPAAILIWKSHFSALPLGPLVAVAYHMFQLVLDSIAAPSLKQLPLFRPGRAPLNSKKD